MVRRDGILTGVFVDDFFEHNFSDWKFMLGDFFEVQINFLGSLIT
jgi:hypothetical protein